MEINLGAEKPLKAEEVKRCKLKLPMKIKRTARIHCGGHVPTRAIASRHHIKEERVSTPVRRSEHIRGMKRGSDYSDDRSPSSWAATEREDNDLYYWEETPKEKTPEGPNGGGNPNGDDGGNDNDEDPGDVDPFGMHPLCCAACRHSITELYTSVDECF
jgi:hypothetical protein